MTKRPRRNHGAAFRAKMALETLKADQTSIERSERFQAYPYLLRGLDVAGANRLLCSELAVDGHHIAGYNYVHGGFMSAFAERDILELSVAERIQLAQDIWDSIARVPEPLKLSEEEKAEIERRLEAYHQNPEAGSPWSMVRDRIRSRA